MVSLRGGSFFFRILKSILRSWKRNYKGQLTTTFVLILTFSALVSFWNFFENIKSSLFNWGDQIKLNVYLEDDISEGNKSKIQSLLKSSPFFKEIKFISKEDAAQKFKEKISQMDIDIKGEGGLGNPLPNSYEFHLQESASVMERYQEVKRLAKKLLKIKGVDEASYGKTWIEDYKLLVQGFSSTSVGILVILFLGSLMIIGSEINSSISARSKEIEIYELIGATKTMIQLPFIIEGAFIGFVSMIFALILGKIFFVWQQGILNTDLGFLGLNWSYLGFFEGFSFLCVGALAGALGSFISIQIINSGWRAAEKKL